MNFGQKLLRFVHPKAEQERMEFRFEISRNQAHAEDLTRAIVGMDMCALRDALQDRKEPR